MINPCKKLLMSDRVKTICCILLLLLFARQGLAQYRTFDYQDVSYGVFEANPENVSLHWKNAAGEPYASLTNLKRDLEKTRTIKMLMNAGIFSQDNQPAGLWIERGTTLQPLNTKKGKGNFHVQPNGVFLLKDKKAQILTTAQYQKNKPKAEFAVQSGPMLVINGKINSQFRATLNSPYTRNAVCVSKDGRLFFINTLKGKPNMYWLSHALLSIDCHNALYLDGSISSWYIPGEFSSFHWHNFVGMIAVTVDE